MDKILPSGYYTQDKTNPNRIRLRQGPYTGLQFEIMDKIKIREEFLTSTPQLIYNSMIVDYGKHNPTECDSSKILCRIIAAIAVELISEDIQNGGNIESI